MQTESFTTATTTATAAANKQLMQRIFAELAQGNGRPFVDSLADDFCWTMKGRTAWSGVYRGKQAVRHRLLDPLFAKFAGPYTNTAHRFIAEDDVVIVECSGRVTTLSGVPYHNDYCYICRLADGKLTELIEYMDTELVTAALGEPKSLPETVAR